jgi:integrase
MATNCTINGKEYFRIRKKVGEDENGKPTYKPFYGTSKKDAERLVKEWEDNKRSNTADDYFSRVAKYFTDEVLMQDSRYATGTREKYECAYRLYVAPSDMAKKKLSEISSKDVQLFYNQLKKKEFKHFVSKKKGYVTKNIGQGAMKTVNKYLSLFFRYAEIEGYCRNPLLNVTLPRIESDKFVDEIVTFSEEEIKRIIPCLDDRVKFLFLLAMGTGLREGELLSLKYKNITDTGVKVSSQLVTRNKLTSQGKRFKEEDTKSESGYRFVLMPESLIKEFEAHRERHQKEMEDNNYTTEYVFTTKDGNFIDRRNLRRSHIRLLGRAGFKEDELKKFHAYRATYGTMLCKRGVSIQTASELMGHKSIKTTAKYYIFVENEEKQNAANELNFLFQ